MSIDTQNPEPPQHALKVGIVGRLEDLDEITATHTPQTKAVEIPIEIIETVDKDTRMPVRKNK